MCKSFQLANSSGLRLLYAVVTLGNTTVSDCNMNKITVTVHR